jgi:hypothetical protein
MQSRLNGKEYVLDRVRSISVHILVANKYAEILLCKLPHFAFVTLIFQMKQLMYQGCHGSAFEIKTNFLFFMNLNFLLKKTPSFRKNQDYALIRASSSKGPTIFFLKGKHSDLNILNSHFFNFFTLNYPVKELLE